MKVEAFETAVIAFIGNLIMCFTSHCPIIFSMSQAVDTGNINL